MTPVQVIVAALLTAAVMMFVFHIYGFPGAMVIFICAIWLFASKE